MNDKKIIVENALYILGLKDSNIDEATRRYTYRARSPGVKPTTGIKLILPKTSSMGQKIQKVLDGDDPKKLKQMNNLVIGREDDGKEISLEFKTAASREKFRKMMNESVELDETVKIMFKGFGKEVTDFQQKLKKFGFDKQYRKMMQNFKKNANPGDGFFFIEEIPSDDERKRTKIGDSMKLEVLPVDGNYYNLKKLGDSDEQKRGGTVYKVRLLAIKEDVQLDEEVIKARVAFFGRPSKNNSDMRDAKKKNMFADAKDVDRAKGKMFDVTFNSRRQFNRFESEYDFLMVKVFEDVQLDEERVPTYVIDRQSKKIVHGPTDTADAKLYMKKQVQPRKFMIRQIRGEAKKVGDTV